jgi:riboflavin kinase / FMN adenylyltransferase
MTRKKRAITTIIGEVVHGSKDGASLGFPTANIESEHHIDLEHGVYAVFISIDGKRHRGVMHFGPRLVFGETKALCEVHIFNFKEDVYGRRVSVDVVKAMRPTKDFHSIEELKQQIAKDCEHAQNLLNVLE